MSAEGREPTEEEMRAALEEQMRNIRVEDVVLQTVATLVNLAGRRLGLAAEPGQDASGDVDLQQAKLAIDGARALVPLCPAGAGRADQAGPDPAADGLRAAGRAAARRRQAAPRAGARSRRPRPRPGEEEERAKARAKIWTPGSVTEAVGIFGGSGLLPLPRRRRGGGGRHAVRAAVGAASGSGQIEGTPVAFMPRHGDDHTLPPHRINYRANVWAMKEVGVRRIIGPSRLRRAQAGARAGHVRDLRPVRGPHPRPRGHLLRRAADHPRLGRRPLLRRPARDAARRRRASWTSRWCDGGHGGGHRRARASPPGPSRAGSPQAGWDVVNMTQYPEAWLARELELCYANVSLVTDYDVGLEGMPEVPAGVRRRGVRGFRRQPR